MIVIAAQNTPELQSALTTANQCVAMSAMSNDLRTKLGGACQAISMDDPELGLILTHVDAALERLSDHLAEKATSLVLEHV